MKILDKQLILQELNKHTKKISPNGCWLYQNIEESGYGVIRINYISYKVHRLSLWIFKDFGLASKLWALHKPICPNRNCWNPEHLYAGTRLDNLCDAVKTKTHVQARKTHCPQGHEYTYVHYTTKLNGKRICKICQKDAKIRYNRKISGLN